MTTALSLMFAGASSNGRTRVFGALNLGSNPSAPNLYRRDMFIFSAFGISVIAFVFFLSKSNDNSNNHIKRMQSQRNFFDN